MTAPTHLSAESKKWFASVLRNYDLDEHHIKLLRLACESYDLAQRARKELHSAGLVYTDKNGTPKTRPEAKIFNDNKISFARLVRELNLDAADVEEARPPRIAGRY